MTIIKRNLTKSILLCLNSADSVPSCCAEAHSNRLPRYTPWCLICRVATHVPQVPGSPLAEDLAVLLAQPQVALTASSGGAGRMSLLLLFLWPTMAPNQIMMSVGLRSRSLPQRGTAEPMTTSSDYTLTGKSKELTSTVLSTTLGYCGAR